MARKPGKKRAIDYSAPLAEVRITALELERLDAIRVRVIISLSSFTRPPDLIITLSDAHGSRLAGIIVLETPEPVNRIVLHLSQPPPTPEVILAVRLKYDEIGQIDVMEQLFPFA